MFEDDSDRIDFCGRLARVIREFKWTCYAFCLMTTHYHLVVDVAENALQPGMHGLNGPYAQAFNRRHGRSGHLRGDRYHAFSVASEGHLLQLIRYVARNPVVAGLCDHPAAWPWGSYRSCVGLDVGFPFVSNESVLRHFGADSANAVRILRAFVEDP